MGETSPTLSERFNRIADWLTVALGSLPALVGSVLLVVVWAITGPVFNFSDTWQLFINTTTTVVTFWMVFVIQNSANRSAKATQLKLDEIIRSLEDARNSFISLDQATEEELSEHEEEFHELVKSEDGEGGAPDRKGKRGDDAAGDDDGQDAEDVNAAIKAHEDDHAASRPHEHHGRGAGREGDKKG